MPTKFNRLRLSGKGSKYYLEFLRNLTPQIFLFTFTVVIGDKIDFTQFDLSNWRETLIFYVLLIAFWIAFIGNIKQLFEGCYGDIQSWGKKISAKANRTRQLIFLRFFFYIVAAIRMRWIVFIEIIFFVILLQIALAMIIIASISSAVSILKMV
jgi:hypothetical protein